MRRALEERSQKLKKLKVLERSVMYTLFDFSTKIEMVLERRAMSLELK